MLNEVKEFKYKLRLYLNSLGIIASFFFAILQFIRSDHWTALISLMGSVYFSVIVYLLVSKNHYLWKGRGFVLFVPVTILNVIHVHPEFGIFWAYVGVAAIFLVMEFIEACIWVVIFLILTFIVVYPHYPGAVLFRIYATLLLVSLFSYAFSYLIEKLHVRLVAIATHDPLTRALNRYTFNSSIENALQEAIRYKTPSSLFLLDLDHFKKVNDDFGHPKGDTILKELVAVIGKRLRASDQLFRYGGEEFAVLLRHTSLENAATLAEDIRQTIEQHSFDLPRSITISGGLAEVREIDDMESWIKRADQALYRAKSAGRNCIIEG